MIPLKWDLRNKERKRQENQALKYKLTVARGEVVAEGEWVN